MLVNIPSTIIRNIISAEINYYNFRNNPSFDGFSVISSYHKALDIIIEEYITSDFRKFIDKSKLPKYIENNSLEKSLKSVILNNYSLSAGRLYHLLQIINDKEKLNHYTFLFSKFIKKHSYLEEILLEDKEFFEVYEKIINTEVLGSKRHSGRIDFVETREARRLLIGDFKDKNCLIYKLMMIGEV
ncbi:MAG: hypothetical protein Q9M97_08745 [Candidatus Gracilibacteria bacterium]|nr:hypothetical protein [Candidatus Gracilibacteria bacterium]